MHLLLALLALFHRSSTVVLAFSLRLSLPSSISRRDHLQRSFSSVAASIFSSIGAAVSSDAMVEPSVLSDNQKHVLRWGIVGLGDVTEIKSGPPFWKCKGSMLAAVMRRTPGKAQTWAERVPLDMNHNEKCVGYANLDDFLHHPDLDAVYIATRPGSHLELCEKVAAAGIQSVYVEKPVGRCAAETQAMANTMNEAGGQLYTAYISRAYPRTQAVRKLLQEGVVGDCVTSVNYRLVGTGGARDLDSTAGDDIPWRFDAAQSGGGLIMDVGCHVIDRIDYLCGPILHLQGHAENRAKSPGINVEDYVSFQGEIGSCDWAAIPSEGATVSCTWDFSGSSNDKEECDMLEIAGRKGSLRMAAMSASLPVEVCDRDGNVLRQVEFEMPEHTAQYMIQAITDELRSGNLPAPSEASYISRADNAVRTSRVLDAALARYYGNRDIGYWEKPDSWPGRTAV